MTLAQRRLRAARARRAELERQKVAALIAMACCALIVGCTLALFCGVGV